MKQDTQCVFIIAPLCILVSVLHYLHTITSLNIVIVDYTIKTVQLRGEFMKVQLMYILSKWAYKMLRPHIVEFVEDKLKPHWTVMILYELDEFFGYNFKCGDGHYDNHDIQS